jgi:hypothetical protein
LADERYEEGVVMAAGEGARMMAEDEIIEEADGPAPSA